MQRGAEILWAAMRCPALSWLAAHYFAVSSGSMHMGADDAPQTSHEERKSLQLSLQSVSVAAGVRFPDIDVMQASWCDKSVALAIMSLLAEVQAQIMLGMHQRLASSAVTHRISGISVPSISWPSNRAHTICGRKGSTLTLICRIQICTCCRHVPRRIRSGRHLRIGISIRLVCQIPAREARIQSPASAHNKYPLLLHYLIMLDTCEYLQSTSCATAIQSISHLPCEPGS